MTEIPPAIDFLVRLGTIDRSTLKVRDILVLWAVSREDGLMGREVAMKLGFKSRSNVQDGIRRLIDQGYVEDRRAVKNQLTPNDLYITPKGTMFLASVVPL